MINLSVRNFSGFEMICNKSEMVNELENNKIGYLKLGEYIYPVIQVEVTYDTSFYVGVDVPKKAVIPVAVIAETPDGAEDLTWFGMNDIVAGSDETYYDYVIPTAERWISKDIETAKEPRLLTIEQVGKWYELCDITEDEENENSIIMRYSSKEILHSVGATEFIKTILAVLHYRQERFSLLKWNDEYGDMHPVMRFSERGKTRYYAVEYEHTEAISFKYAVHLTEVDEAEVYNYKVENDKKKFYGIS